jgi:hypothetical protein
MFTAAATSGTTTLLLLTSLRAYYYYYYYYRYSALGPVWAETRAQSGDWYGSGALHPGQILRGSLPLVSSAFRRSNFRHQVLPRPPRRERSQWRKVELWSGILPKWRHPRHLGIFYMPQIYEMGPKEGVLRIFSPLKVRRLRPGLNPRTWVLKTSMLPLDHRSRWLYACRRTNYHGNNLFIMQFPPFSFYSLLF